MSDSDVTPPAEPNPKNPGHRTKAARLRGRVRAGQALSPEETAWLDDYERAQREGATASAGASISSRLVHVEETAAAIGTGAAAEVAAAAALAREEGRRIDYLAKTGIEALERAFKMCMAMTELMASRLQAMEDVHMSMLDAVREHYIARTDAEVEAIRAAGQETGIEQQLAGVLAQRVLAPPAPPQSAPRVKRKR